MSHSSQSVFDLQEVLESVDEIAPLPDITIRIMNAADDPRSNAYQLLKTVLHDPALASRILRLVNSSFHGLSSSITSLERAITLLGFNAVKNLAVASSVSTLFQGGRLCLSFSMRDLWTHSIAVGVCAKELARSMKLPNFDEAFLAGLLHDLGLLIEHQKFPDELAAICDQAQASPLGVCQLETGRFGFDHQALGGAIGQRWKFPAPVCAAMAYHHRPREAPVESRSLAALIYVADTLCSHADEGFNLTAGRQEIHDDIAAIVPVTPDVIEATRQGLKELTRRASPFVG
jgi:putative nucleotidyltransferase with HDIG domain